MRLWGFKQFSISLRHNVFHSRYPVSKKLRRSASTRMEHHSNLKASVFRYFCVHYNELRQAFFSVCLLYSVAISKKSRWFGQAITVKNACHNKPFKWLFELKLRVRFLQKQILNPNSRPKILIGTEFIDPFRTMTTCNNLRRTQKQIPTQNLMTSSQTPHCQTGLIRFSFIYSCNMCLFACSFMKECKYI